MGLGYTVDTPLKVAHLGISSVISIVDDFLMEKMRKFYSLKLDLPFKEIAEGSDDSRAKRITAYLNMVDQLVSKRIEELIDNFQKKGSELERYFDLLPDAESIRSRFNQFVQGKSLDEVKNWLRANLIRGSIDVNIMTKLDKVNYKNNEPLPIEYNDAHAALRGFANSTLSSSLILSAGMNPRLYSYIEKFEDFYPNEEGFLKKKIILKVSDYRSALVQGLMMAKKGIWVSEYRVESGLNCGGHAFATQGNLMGPILEEFREKKTSLVNEIFPVYIKVLEAKGKTWPNKAPVIKITAQGGVGTNEEHQFLLDEYHLDSIGWGSPFMLVPEVCNIDRESLELLKNAGEEDLYLSNASPLGVPFNNVKNSTQQKQISHYLQEGKVGFPCTKRYLTFNTDYSERPICTASRLYQRQKTEDIKNSGSCETEQRETIELLHQKECLCEGLTNSAYLANQIAPDSPRTGVSICPGPNIAYFSKEATLIEMVGHIYGKTDILGSAKRPNLFVKELKMYIDYLDEKKQELNKNNSQKQIAYYTSFKKNLQDGIIYYKELFSRHKDTLKEMKRDVFSDLEFLSRKLENIKL